MLLNKVERESYYSVKKMNLRRSFLSCNAVADSIRFGKTKAELLAFWVRRVYEKGRVWGVDFFIV